MHPKSEQEAAGQQAPALQPYAVPIKLARQLLGNKSHSVIYDCIGRGQLHALKDGTKTLITVESIRRYMTNLPVAKIKPPRPRLAPSDVSDDEGKNHGNVLLTAIHQKWKCR